MAVCPQCGAVHMPSARICRKCGARLVSGEPPEPTPSESALLDFEEPVLMLTVASSGERLRLMGQPEYILGRADPERRIWVDVDTTDYKGWESGVSRRHARIFVQQGRFFVEDLRSANGTYLNEIRLEPGRSYELQTGDTIKLGILRFYVEF